MCPRVTLFASVYDPMLALLRRRRTAVVRGSLPVAHSRACPYTMAVLRNWRTGRTAAASTDAVGEQLALLLAAASLYGLYYQQLALAWARSLGPSGLRSLPDSVRMVRLAHRLRRYTALFPLRLCNLYRLSREIDRLSVPGDVVECGVYNGGSAALMASICTRSSADRKIWLFDSFEGLPQPTEKDGQKARDCCWWCHGDLSMVRGVFDKLGIPEPRTRIVKGWFHETFPRVDIPEIALLHIDADWYESVKLCFERFYDRVRPGGFIVIDDYGHWEGARRATDEFLAKLAINARLTRVDYTGRYFQKPWDCT